MSAAVADDDEAGAPVGLSAGEVRGAGRRRRARTSTVGHRHAAVRPRDDVAAWRRHGLGHTGSHCRPTARRCRRAARGAASRAARTSSSAMLARFTSGPKLADQPGLLVLARRLEEQPVGARAAAPRRATMSSRTLPSRPVEPDRAALAALGDHPAAPASRSPAISSRPLAGRVSASSGPCARPRRARRSAPRRARSRACFVGQRSWAPRPGRPRRSRSRPRAPSPGTRSALPCAQAISSSVPPETGPDVGRREQGQLGRAARRRRRRCPSRTSRCRCAPRHPAGPTRWRHDWRPCRARA